MPDDDLAAELAQIRASLDAAEGAVRAETAERKKENAKRDERIKWSRRAIAIVLVVAVVSLIVGAVGINAARRANDNLDDYKKLTAEQAQQGAVQTLERRRADCLSLDDIANAIKQGNIGSISVLLDPQFTGSTDPSRLQMFVDAFIAGGSAGIDKAIADARVKKGYSADCTQIGAPPTQGG